MFALGDRSHTSPQAAVDTYRAELIEVEASICRLRTRQVQLLTWLQGCAATLDNGARSMHEWLRAEIDVSAHTARDLMKAVDFAFDDRCPDVATLASFDRMVAVAGLARAGASFDDLQAATDRDIEGIDKQAALLRRVTRVSEHQVAQRRFLKVEPTMGNAAWRISGIAPALDGDIIQRALQARGDHLTEGAGPEVERPDPGQRMLDALTTLAYDYLDPQEEGASGTRQGAPTDDDIYPSSDDPGHRPGGTPLASVTVFVDAHIVEWRGKGAGAYVAAGPRIGPEALDRITCNGAVGIVGLDHLGNPTAASGKSRIIPPAVRAYVLHRDGGCVVAGCRSRYRLEPHHILHRSQGGDHHPDNLATLCWYHHHIAIHHDGYQIDPHSPPQRRRFLPDRRNRYRAPPEAA